uniref:Uncharacterized protein n=1 Tax=Quercus lobata TaxID=97700 RepID=A0A7N2MY72_QUELO
MEKHTLPLLGSTQGEEDSKREITVIVACTVEEDREVIMDLEQMDEQETPGILLHAISADQCTQGEEVECAIDQTTYITEFESFILKEWKDKINPLGRKMKERICSVDSVVLFCPWFLCQSIGKEKKEKNWFSFLRVRNIFLPCQPLQQL